MQNVALITGASSGIGRALAEIHAEAGGDVVAVATNADRLQSLKGSLEAEHGITVMTIVQDLTADGAAQAVYDAVRDAGVAVDYLINNAGFGGHGRFHERVWADDLAMIRLNIVALTALTRLFLPDFIARNRGRVLNTSSTAGLVPGPLQAVYFATKAYVNSFGNALAGELHDSAVTVTNLLPGATQTGFAATAGLDKTDLFAKTASAESVARDGYAAMMRGDLDVVSGLPVSQRLTLRLAPFLPKRMILDRVRRQQEAKA